MSLSVTVRLIYAELVTMNEITSITKTFTAFIGVHVLSGELFNFFPPPPHTNTLAHSQVLASKCKLIYNAECSKWRTELKLCLFHPDDITTLSDAKFYELCHHVGTRIFVFPFYAPTLLKYLYYNLIKHNKISLIN